MSKKITDKEAFRILLLELSLKQKSGKMSKEQNIKEFLLETASNQIARDMIKNGTNSKNPIKMPLESLSYLLGDNGYMLEFPKMVFMGREVEAY